MEKAKVIGPNGLAPISLQRQADIRITTEVIYDVITNSNMISLEESAHAPAAVRNKARADRLAGVQTMSARLNGRRFTQMDVNDEPRKLCDASKEIEKAMKLAKVYHTLSPIHAPIHTLTFPHVHVILYLTRSCSLLLFPFRSRVPSIPVTFEDNTYLSSLLRSHTGLA